MQISHSSREAYKKVKEKKTDVLQREAVYNALMRLNNRMGTASDITVELTRTPGNTLGYYDVNRRIGDLVNIGLVEIISEKGGKSFRKNTCRIYKIGSAPVIEQPVNTNQMQLFN